MSVLDQFLLTDRIAVVTGGNRGLGRAMAEAFAEAGAHVAIAARNATLCEETATAISGRSERRAVAVPTDVTDAAAVDALVQTVLEFFGKIDVWVNCAGINIRHPVEAFPVEDYDRILDVNLKGAWLCCRAIAPHLKRQRSGSVINVGSVLSAVGLAERTAYCASKAGILGLTRTLALEWAPFNVRCNALCPGPFLTEINRPLLKTPEKVKSLLANTALRRWGEISEIQGAAVFLASDASSYMTGAALYVDGGWSAH